MVKDPLIRAAIRMLRVIAYFNEEYNFFANLVEHKYERGEIKNLDDYYKAFNHFKQKIENARKRN